jgi:hypothetical protein
MWKKQTECGQQVLMHMNCWMSAAKASGEQQLSVFRHVAVCALRVCSAVAGAEQDVGRRDLSQQHGVEGAYDGAQLLLYLVAVGLFSILMASMFPARDWQQTSLQPGIHQQLIKCLTLLSCCCLCFFC